MKNLFACVVIGLAACGGGSKAAPATPASTATASSTELTLGELRFYEGDRLGLKLHADGTIELRTSKPEQPEAWTKVAVLTKDGKVSRDGKLLGQLASDGTFQVPGEQTSEFHLEGDTLVAADRKVTIDDKGMLQGANPGAPQMRVEGATDAGSRRTALLLIAVISTSGPATPAP